MTESLNYAERAVLLERIEALETDLLIERALNARLQTGLDYFLVQLEHGITDAEAQRLHLTRTPDGLEVGL